MLMCLEASADTLLDPCASESVRPSHFHLSSAEIKAMYAPSRAASSSVVRGEEGGYSSESGGDAYGEDGGGEGTQGLGFVTHTLVGQKVGARVMSLDLLYAQAIVLDPIFQVTV